MCAIAGFWGNRGKADLGKMLHVLNHRGPDDSGTHIDGDVFLGNNRLAIIDLSSKGHQPMFNEDKSICIVYNGEIYNFKDIRKVLEKKYKFKSNSDTEVILRGYQEWGTQVLQKLNGMFAFVIYDKKKNLLFGARDRLGEKPFKYYWDGSFFAFASEIKGLLPIIPSSPEPDISALEEYLILLYVPAPKTGFKNIFKLPPASYFIFQNKKLTIKKYWSLDFSDKLNLNEEEWEELIFEKLKNSVESRMIADVPVGTFLSGGVDSSTVTGLAAAVTARKLNTFNIGFDNTELDESMYATKVAQVYHTQHHNLIVDSEMTKKTLLGSFEYFDEPFADNSLIPTLILSEFTSKKVKVALSGDGGDENFGGYQRYSMLAFGESYKKLPTFVRAGLKLPLRLHEHTKTFVNTVDLPFKQKYLQFNPFFERKTNKSLINTFDPRLSDFDNALKFDILNYLPEDLLFKVDIASMAHSLEVRAPFLNYELLELTAKMPQSLKVGSFHTKYLLKKILKKKKILPQDIIYRKKQGFVSPIEKLLKGDLKDFATETLSQKKYESIPIKKDSRSLFAQVTLSLWSQKYL